MVVDNEDRDHPAAPDVRPGAVSADAVAPIPGSGSVAVIVVPLLSLRIASEPPSSSARSRMLINPYPPACPSRRAVPSPRTRPSRVRAAWLGRREPAAIVADLGDDGVVTH